MYINQDINAYNNKAVGYIYIIIDHLTNKVYVGKRENLNDINTYYGSGKIINRIIKKRGIVHLEKRILGLCYSKEELQHAEEECIYFHRAYGSDGEHYDKIYGYNLKPNSCGGNGGANKGKAPWCKGLTKETNEILKRAGEKISSLKTGVPQSEESNRKRSETCKISLNKPEIKQKISKRHKGIKKSKQHKKRMSIAQSGLNSSVRRFDIDEKINKIFQLREDGVSYNKIAEIFNCSAQAIKNRVKNNVVSLEK